MSKPASRFRNLMIWQYGRGSLQYDIICALILAFIFLVPRSCLVRTRTDNTTAKHLTTMQRAGIDSARTGSCTVANLP